MLGTHLRNLLSSIPPQQQKDIQARLIFEIQTAFMVECTNLLIDELINRRGKIQRSMNALVNPLNFSDIRLIIPA